MTFLDCSALLLGHLLTLDVKGLGADLLGHLVAALVILTTLDWDPGAAGLRSTIAGGAISRLKIYDK